MHDHALLAVVLPELAEEAVLDLLEVGKGEPFGVALVGQRQVADVVVHDVAVGGFVCFWGGAGCVALDGCLGSGGRVLCDRRCDAYPRIHACNEGSAARVNLHTREAHLQEGAGPRLDDLLGGGARVQLPQDLLRLSFGFGRDDLSRGLG